MKSSVRTSAQGNLRACRFEPETMRRERQKQARRVAAEPQA
jgi:hypothetical protein